MTTCILKNLKNALYKYIFPGADASTPLNWYVRQLELAGFAVQTVEKIGRHYSYTLHKWCRCTQRVNTYLHPEMCQPLYTQKKRGRPSAKVKAAKAKAALAKANLLNLPAQQSSKRTRKEAAAAKKNQKK